MVEISRTIVVEINSIKCGREQFLKDLKKHCKALGLTEPDVMMTDTTIFIEVVYNDKFDKLVNIINSYKKIEGDEEVKEQYKYIMFDEDSLACSMEEFLQNLQKIMDKLSLDELKIEMKNTLVIISVEGLSSDKVEELMKHLEAFTAIRPGYSTLPLSLVCSKPVEDTLKNEGTRRISPRPLNTDILGTCHRQRLKEFMQGGGYSKDRLYTDKPKEDSEGVLFPLKVEAMLNVLANGNKRPDLYTEMQSDYDNLKDNLEELDKLKDLISVGTQYGLSVKQFKVLDDTLTEQVKNLIRNNVVMQSLRIVGLIYGLNEQQFAGYVEQLKELEQFLR